MAITTLCIPITRRLGVPIQSWIRIGTGASLTNIDTNMVMCVDNENGQYRSFGSRQAKREKKSGKGAAASGRLNEDEQMTNMLIACLDAPSREEPIDRRTVEEMERRKNIVKAFTVGRFEQHNESEHDMSCKWKLKNFAIEAIPEGYLKDEALKVSESNDDFPPLWRPHALHTPPIPGFNPADWMNDDGDKKI